MSKKDLALYIHWPFCLSKCPYCDFNSHVQASIPHDRWERAYLSELHHYRDLLKQSRITSIFFGGGTPSLMPATMVSSILGEIHYLTQHDPDIEITLEANPTSVEAKHFQSLRDAGINRISLGIQSLRPEALAFLGRTHSTDEARHAIETARTYFNRWSFDLIYGRPGQTLKAWQDELQDALHYGSEHLSLYMLTIEKGTPFYKQFRDGLWTLPSEDESLALFQWTRKKMRSVGMPAYEVSNFAKPGQESRHNHHYWDYRPYLGIGPGAHSRVKTLSGDWEGWMMRHRPDQWLTAVEGEKGNAIQTKEKINAERSHEEKIMMGLRLTKGLDMRSLNYPLPENTLRLFEDEGFLSIEDSRLCLTEKGFPLLNQLLPRLIADKL